MGALKHLNQVNCLYLCTTVAGFYTLMELINIQLLSMQINLSLISIKGYGDGVGVGNGEANNGQGAKSNGKKVKLNNQFFIN